MALSTSRDRLKRIEDVEFRANLNSRLAGIKVSITALRERTSGIPTPAEALRQRIYQNSSKACTLDAKAMKNC